MKIAHYGGLEEQVKDIFAKLSREQSCFTLEGNPIFDLLCEWAQDNPEREVTNADLCLELTELAEKDGNRFVYSGKARSFAQRMKNLRANLAEFFEITERKVGGRKTLYSFKLKKENEDQ